MVFNSNGNNRLNMKKITLLLLLTLSVLGVQAQTYQLNYDSIRVGKTAGLGSTSLYGKVYLKNVGLGASSDSILTVLNGKIRKIPYSGVLSNLGTSAISLGGTANGLSYLAGNYRLHKVTGTTGGVLTTGTDTIAGVKRFTSSPIIATSGSSNLSLFANTSAGEAGLILGTGSTTKWQLFKSNSGNNEDLLLSNLALGRTSLSISLTSNAVRINEIPNVGGSGDSILVHDNTSKEIKRISATTYLTPTGSGSGLSGVMLLTGNQSASGVKTFTDSILSVRVGSNKFKVQGTGASQSATIDIHRGDRIGESTIRYFTKNDASYKWQHGIIGNSSFRIRNATTGIVQESFTIDTLNNVEIIGNFVSTKATGSNTFGSTISSTPQGTLYGTATGSITSAQLATSLTDETGTGSAVFATSPTLVTPNIGVATGSTLALTSNSTLLTGSPSTTTQRALGLFSNTSGNIAWGLNGNSANDLFGNSTTYQALIGTTTNNPFGIGTNNAVVATFETDGDLVITGSNATKASGTAWINPSDLRLKMNIGEYSKGLKEVLAIKPKTWYFNEASGLDKTQKHLSPIAQELQQIMPEMVSTYKGKLNGKEQELLQVDASDMTWLLVKAIQEQQAIIEKLNQRILALENK